MVYHSELADEGVCVLNDRLRRQGRLERLDLVLSTTGGSIIAAWQMALLLRKYVAHMSILVPYRARSAGTLLCLAADELILGPMAELGPIDANVDAAGMPPQDAPATISAEDIRMFDEMAEDWFGVTRDEDRVRVLALLAQRVFPTSLSSFYRFDKLVRQIAGELLAYQLPDASIESQQRIVDRLVGGHHTHDYVLSYQDVQGLGLRARRASSAEELILWEISRACQAQPVQYTGTGVGLIVSGPRLGTQQQHRGRNHSVRPPDGRWYRRLTQSVSRRQAAWRNVLRNSGFM